MSEPFEIIAGPLTLWLAPVGTAFPAIGAAPGAPWAKIGTSGAKSYTEDGVTVQHSQKIDTTRAAGSTGPRKAFRTEEDLIVTVTIMDMTLEQYALALSGAVPTTTAAGVSTPGTKRIGLSRGADVKTYAMLARGASGYGDTFTSQYEVPVCFQSGSPKIARKKGTPAGIELEYTALEHDGATSEDERFGRIISQHQAAL